MVSREAFGDMHCLRILPLTVAGQIALTILYLRQVMKPQSACDAYVCPSVYTHAKTGQPLHLVCCMLHVHRKAAHHFYRN